jgi:crotonobetainyl-CoA:carnitine CoA-transferase CaiB-like acyl-CoA transferase
LSDSPQSLGPVPELGGDNESILRELGYSSAEIAALRRDKVI